VSRRRKREGGMSAAEFGTTLYSGPSPYAREPLPYLATGHDRGRYTSGTRGLGEHRTIDAARQHALAYMSEPPFWARCRPPLPPTCVIKTAAVYGTSSSAFGSTSTPLIVFREGPDGEIVEFDLRNGSAS
jgi:hypothetical protein